MRTKIRCIYLELFHAKIKGDKNNLLSFLSFLLPFQNLIFRFYELYTIYSILKPINYTSLTFILLKHLISAIHL